MRGKTMSSANFVWPVHFARASTLRKGLPTTLKGFASFSLLLINQISHKKAQKAQKGFQATIKIQGHGCPLPSRVSCAFCAFLWPSLLFAAINTLARKFHWLAAHARRRQLHRF